MRRARGYAVPLALAAAAGAAWYFFGERLVAWRAQPEPPPAKLQTLSFDCVAGSASRPGSASGTVRNLSGEALIVDATVRWKWPGADASMVHAPVMPQPLPAGATGEFTIQRVRSASQAECALAPYIDRRSGRVVAHRR